MDEKQCSSLNTSAATTNMNTRQQNNKDISQVFTLLRNKLNNKEKELLESQRAEPCLLAPDDEQVDGLLNAISSLHLSTLEGSFIFADKDSEKSNSIFVYSSGIESIRALPRTEWLSPSKLLKQEQQGEYQNKYRLPMVNHLLSLPISAFVSSSSSSSPPTTTTTMSNSPQVPSNETTEIPANRLPMVNQLLSMSLDAFKPSSKNQTTTEPEQIKEENPTINNDNQMSSTTTMSKSPQMSSNEIREMPANRLPMVNQLLSMPLDAFKPSTTSQIINEPQIEHTKEEKPMTNSDDQTSSTTKPKTILFDQSIYSKEHWLRKSAEPKTENEPASLDIDEYIQKVNEKMRRLHMDYLQALEKLNIPVKSTNESNEAIKSIYSKALEKHNQDSTTTDPNQPSVSKK